MENMKDVLADSKRITGHLAKEHPAFLKAIGAFADAAEAEGALSKKVKTLIAVALAVVRQCTPCVALHVKAALDAGASRDEIMEATFVAAMLGGGPAFMYVKEARKALDDFGAPPRGEAGSG
jgi:AhpD family alkylhydroperoxidase